MYANQSQASAASCAGTPAAVSASTAAPPQPSTVSATAPSKPATVPHTSSFQQQQPIKSAAAPSRPANAQHQNARPLPPPALPMSAPLVSTVQPARAIPPHLRQQVKNPSNLGQAVTTGQQAGHQLSHQPRSAVSDAGRPVTAQSAAYFSEMDEAYFADVNLDANQYADDSFTADTTADGSTYTEQYVRIARTKSVFCADCL